MNYDVDPTTGLLSPEYADIFGVPFEVIPVKGEKPGDVKPPDVSTLVQALPSRQNLAIEFPRVEGYVMDVRSRIRCDVANIPELRVEPQVQPTEVIIRTKMGFMPAHSAGQVTADSETIRRDQFYLEHRLQRTAFEIARDVTEVLAGGKVSMGKAPAVAKREEGARLLFPQVLAVVQEYLATRVAVAPEARIEEVALAIYRDAIISRLLDAIEPDTTVGEAPLLPRIERFRPTGSTTDVFFRTTKPCKETWKSHVSHVVLDSGPYGEGKAVEQLEKNERVQAYVKNERLDFEILYEWENSTHKYIPDFLVRLRNATGPDITLILEVKGYETEQDRAKYAAAQKWVRAVNHHGGFGTWAFMVCKEPDGLGQMLDEYSVPAAA
jgi:type III restriction enzyme